MNGNSPAPCGMICAECEKHTAECFGCAECEGRVWWAAYTDEPLCEYYRCCVLERKLPNCGKCSLFPCATFDTTDPTRTDAENAEIRQRQIENLRNI